MTIEAEFVYDSLREDAVGEKCLEVGPEDPLLYSGAEGH